MQTTRDYHTEDPDTGLMDPMNCNDCGRPTYYDYADENYHHAFNAETGCFLIAPEQRDNDLDHPYIHHWIDA